MSEAHVVSDKVSGGMSDNIETVDATVGLEMTKPMRADAVRNHEKILLAAEEIFAVDGVMVPIDLIAERAGVGIGTLYRHFPTKESLYEAIVVTRISMVLDIADACAQESDPGTALFNFLRVFATEVSDKQDLFESLIQAGIDIKSKLADQVEELMRRVDVLRRLAVDAGTVREDVTTSDMLNLVMGTCHAAGHSGNDDEGLLRLVNIVIAGIQPHAARSSTQPND
jgi:AcrR family transcriptional regulator